MYRTSLATAFVGQVLACFFSEGMTTQGCAAVKHQQPTRPPLSLLVPCSLVPLSGPTLPSWVLVLCSALLFVLLLHIFKFILFFCASTFSTHVASTSAELSYIKTIISSYLHNKCISNYVLHHRQTTRYTHFNRPNTNMIHNNTKYNHITCPQHPTLFIHKHTHDTQHHRLALTIL